MKISARLVVNTTTEYKTFTLDDLNVTQEEWEALTDEEKEQKVRDAVFDLPEQPYWCIERFEEKD